MHFLGAAGLESLPRINGLNIVEKLFHITCMSLNKMVGSATCCGHVDVGSHAMKYNVSWIYNGSGGSCQGFCSRPEEIGALTRDNLSRSPCSAWVAKVSCGPLPLFYYHFEMCVMRVSVIFMIVSFESCFS